MTKNKNQYVVSFLVTIYGGRTYKKKEFIFSADDPDEYLSNFKRRVLALGDIKEVIFTDPKKID